VYLHPTNFNASLSQGFQHHITPHHPSALVHYTITSLTTSRESAVRTIFLCSSGLNGVMMTSLWTTYQTTFPVFSNLGITLVWRTTSIVKTGEAGVSVGDDIFGRGVVSGLIVRIDESFAATLSTLSLPSPLLRLFRRSSGTEPRRTSLFSKGRYHLSLRASSSSPATYPLRQYLYYSPLRC
jgi:hypothetical protein